MDRLMPRAASTPEICRWILRPRRHGKPFESLREKVTGPRLAAGVRRPETCHFDLLGKRLDVASEADAVEAGIALVPKGGILILAVSMSALARRYAATR